MRLPRPRAGHSSRTSRAAPFLLAGVLAFATVPLTPVRQPVALAVAAVLAAAAALLILVAPARVPDRAWRGIALAFLAIPILLSVAAGGPNPSYAPLLMLPLAWCAMYGSAWSLYAILAASAVWLLMRLVVDPGVLKPGSWRENVLFLLTAIVIAPTVQRLVQTLKRRDEELAERLAGLDASERRVRQIIDMAPEAFVEFDADGRITDWNPRAESISGYGRDEALGRSFSETLLAPDERAAFEAGRSTFLERGSGWLAGRRVELTCLARSGRRFPVELTLTAYWNGSPGWTFRVFLHDVTEQRRAREELAEAEERFRLAFRDAPVGMVLAEPGGAFLRVNQAMCEITGYSEDALLGLDPEVIFDPVDDVAALQHEQLLAGQVRSYRLDRRIRHAAGHHVWVSVSVSLLRRLPDDPGLLIGQVEDISERKRFEGQLAYLADHDHLTGLLNRRAFQDALTSQLAYARRYTHAGAVLVVDLDNFKDINDTLGHAAGDELISRVAGLLRVRLRKTDVLGRLGGDEFAVVLPETGRAEAELVARELLGAVRSQTVAVDGDRPLRVSASVGVALFGGGTELTAEEVLVNADIAMYDAKEAGRARVAVSAETHERQAQMKARLTWAQRIREALAEDRFTLYEQPIVDLATGRVAAHELLLRMIDDHGEIVPPGAFLPVAERFGLVQDIDRWVVRTAIRTLAREQAAGREVRFEVNLSGASVTDPDLEHYIEVELASSGADPAGLVFELTETAAIVNVDRASRFASRLGELGAEFALDDFGAGFGSFYYLKHLPFDYLKIDGDFVRTLTQSREDQHVVKAIVEIASGMGKKTVAEFVGDEETVAMLADFGVDYGQGYFLGRPAPLADILAPGWQPALGEPVEHSAG